MMKAKTLWAPRPLPIAARGLKKGVGARHVGFDEHTRRVDGAVNVAFGGKVQDRVRPMLGKYPVHGSGVANIRMLKRIAWMVRNTGHVGKAGGIGQRIEIDDLMPPRDGQPHDRGPDKTRPAGHQKLHGASPKAKGVPHSRRRGAAASFSDRCASDRVKPQSTPISGSSNAIARSHSGAS